MKKTSFFVAAGAVVLSVAGFIATKANVKFANVTSAHFSGISTPGTFIASGHLTTVKSANSRTLYLATVTSGNTNLHTAVTLGAVNPVQVYYK